MAHGGAAAFKYLMNHFVVISGCSGGGKSTLLSALQRQGHAVVEEPGRRVVRVQLETGGSALPWQDTEAFLHRVLDLTRSDYDRAGAAGGGWVFFDRSWVDAATALQALTGMSVTQMRRRELRYHRCVFLAPPWPEIYRRDPERRHDVQAALDEYERLLHAYPALGYEVHLLPKDSVESRADFVLETLARERTAR